MFRKDFGAGIDSSTSSLYRLSIDDGYLCPSGQSVLASVVAQARKSNYNSITQTHPDQPLHQHNAHALIQDVLPNRSLPASVQPTHICRCD